MSGFLELLAFLYEAGAAVIPWVLLALAVVLVFKLYPYVVTWLQARAAAQQDIAEREAERNEIMRNNSVVIENNTETLSMLKRFIESSERNSCAAIDKHEQLSAERMERILNTTEAAAHEVGKLRGEVGVLLDRTRKAG